MNTLQNVTGLRFIRSRVGILKLVSELLGVFKTATTFFAESLLSNKLFSFNSSLFNVLKINEF